MQSDTCTVSVALATPIAPFDNACAKPVAGATHPVGNVVGPPLTMSQNL